MTRNELLRTIEILFWEQSFSELSMDAIAKKLDMKKASLYYHFPSKDEMFLSVLEYSFESFLEHLNSLKNTQEPRDIVRACIEFPYKEKNLFSIVSQKWYCQIALIESWMFEKQAFVRNHVITLCHERFAWTNERTILFLSLLDSLAKQCCMNCKQETPDIDSLITEIVHLFF